MYIVLEGVVGTGKSTQAQNLYEYFVEKYPDRKVELVREPGGTEIAEAIRVLVNGTRFEEKMDKITDAYLFAAARAQLLSSVVKPILDEGGIVISDRSFCSSLSYQGYVQGLSIDRVWKINREAILDVMPDLILFMDLDIELGHSRTFDPEGDKRERKGLDFFHKAREGYLELATFEPTKDAFRIMDASGSREEVFDRLVAEIENE